MFGIGMTELLVILVVALIVFGPTRLPELARSLGRAMNEFRRASTDLRRSIDDAIGEDAPPARREPNRIASPQAEVPSAAGAASAAAPAAAAAPDASGVAPATASAEPLRSNG